MVNLWLVLSQSPQRRRPGLQRRGADRLTTAPLELNLQSLGPAFLAGVKQKLRTEPYNQSTTETCTLYYIGAMAGDRELIGLLKQKGADINARDAKLGQTALQTTVLDGDTSATALADPGWGQRQHPFALHRLDAALRCDRAGPGLAGRVAAGLGGRSRLCPKRLSAPRRCTAPIMDRQTTHALLLLEHHADPNRLSGMGVPPLHLAASLGQPKMVEILLRGGADPNLKTSNGTTPLQAAHGRKDIEDLLKRYGAGKTAKKTGKTE